MWDTNAKIHLTLFATHFILSSFIIKKQHLNSYNLLKKMFYKLLLNKRIFFILCHALTYKLLYLFIAI